MSQKNAVSWRFCGKRTVQVRLSLEPRKDYRDGISSRSIARVRVLFEIRYADINKWQRAELFPVWRDSNSTKRNGCRERWQLEKMWWKATLDVKLRNILIRLKYYTTDLHFSDTQTKDPYMGPNYLKLKKCFWFKKSWDNDRAPKIWSTCLWYWNSKHSHIRSVFKHWSKWFSIEERRTTRCALNFVIFIEFLSHVKPKNIWKSVNLYKVK